MQPSPCSSANGLRGRGVVLRGSAADVLVAPTTARTSSEDHEVSEPFWHQRAWNPGHVSSNATSSASSLRVDRRWHDQLPMVAVTEREQSCTGEPGSPLSESAPHLQGWQCASARGLVQSLEDPHSQSSSATNPHGVGCRSSILRVRPPRSTVADTNERHVSFGPGQVQEFAVSDSSPETTRGCRRVFGGELAAVLETEMRPSQLGQSYTHSAAVAGGFFSMRAQTKRPQRKVISASRNSDIQRLRPGIRDCAVNEDMP